MKYKKFGFNKIKVSEYCLGSMTWGEITEKEEAHLQIDYSIDRGINFIDTAELYPTNPIKRETAGKTEKIIGDWIKKSKSRDKIVLATKIVGNNSTTIRDGTKINSKNIKLALEKSLKRLNTDCIDLYQLHWPNRGSYHFRKNWNFLPFKLDIEELNDDIYETLNTLSSLVQEGKIREFGLSNESAWGVMKFLEIAKKFNFIKVSSIQNEYSLLCRLFDTDLSEVSIYEKVFLMCYSPLSAGLLTGKYQNSEKPLNSRIIVNPSLGGRLNKRSKKVVNKYISLAKKYSININHMSLAFCASRPFMGSVIIGASNMNQLKFLLNGIETKLSEELLYEINKINRQNPFPF